MTGEEFLRYDYPLVDISLINLKFPLFIEYPEITLKLEEAFRSLSWKNVGINVSFQKLHNLGYVNNIVLISNMYEELKEIHRQLGKISTMTNTEEI